MCDKAAYHVTIRSRNIKLGRKKKQVEQALVMVMLALHVVSVGRQRASVAILPRSSPAEGGGSGDVSLRGHTSALETGGCSDFLVVMTTPRVATHRGYLSPHSTHTYTTHIHKSHTYTTTHTTHTSQTTYTNHTCTCVHTDTTHMVHLSLTCLWVILPAQPVVRRRPCRAATPSLTI